MLVYSRVRDPLKFAAQADKNHPDLHHLFSGTLKQMVSARPLDQILSAREELGTAICDQLNAEIDPALGLHIERVKVMEIVVSKEVLASMPVPGDFPPECPACGAPLNPSGSAGLHQLKCEYCGYMVPSGDRRSQEVIPEGHSPSHMHSRMTLLVFRFLMLGFTTKDTFMDACSYALRNVVE